VHDVIAEPDEMDPEHAIPRQDIDSTSRTIDLHNAAWDPALIIRCMD
jgi:hypothetical protein